MKTILVIDDEMAIREMLTASLEDEGYQVVEAANGREGWLRLGQGHLDLVISDIMMPFMDGRELCSRMKVHPVYSAIPLILMSAAGLAVNKQDCVIAAFLQKPFALDYLFGLIESVIGKASAT